MLILPRKEHQSITLTLETGEIVGIRIHRLANHRVELGFDAPMTVRIERTEMKRN